MKAKYKSNFERKVGGILRRNKIKFKEEVKFDDLKGVGNGLLRFNLNCLLKLMEDNIGFL